MFLGLGLGNDNILNVGGGSAPATYLLWNSQPLSWNGQYLLW